ncbi:hypothetical protein THOM_0094 [Trachipleistophora hominis]|uniref:Uncharacterized protein n=1 Tax=Trachipleistophora hominis TaxID=72359 RepID=L7JZK4_TRAHO|nr:hypothetical protein THOM_0094 [Trachipleistophora hominis]
MHKYLTRRAKRVKALHRRINKIRPGILVRNTLSQQDKEKECRKERVRMKIRRNRHNQPIMSGKDVIMRIERISK